MVNHENDPNHTESKVQMYLCHTFYNSTKQSFRMYKSFNKTIYMDYMDYIMDDIMDYIVYKIY